MRNDTLTGSKGIILERIKIERYQWITIVQAQT